MPNRVGGKHNAPRNRRSKYLGQELFLGPLCDPNPTLVILLAHQRDTLLPYNEGTWKGSQ